MVFSPSKVAEGDLRNNVPMILCALLTDMDAATGLRSWCELRKGKQQHVVAARLDSSHTCTHCNIHVEVQLSSLFMFYFVCRTCWCCIGLSRSCTASLCLDWRANTAQSEIYLAEQQRRPNPLSLLSGNKCQHKGQTKG